MKTFCLVLAICGGHGHASRQVLAVMLAGQFDAATTYHLLRTDPHSYEMNPALRPVARSVAVFPVMAAANLGEVWLAGRVGRKHPKVAAWMMGLAAGEQVGFAVHNLRLESEYRLTFPSSPGLVHWPSHPPDGPVCEASTCRATVLTGKVTRGR